MKHWLCVYLSTYDQTVTLEKNILPVPILKCKTSETGEDLGWYLQNGAKLEDQTILLINFSRIL